MTTQRRTLVTIICAFAVLASVIGVSAQAPKEKETRPKHDVMVEHHGFGFNVGGAGQGHMAFGQGDNTFVFVSSEMSIDGKLVKGAPYSAQAVTENVQTLADGNRIVRRNTASVYRDSEGRTRREQTINAVGPYAAAEPQQSVFINDPVARVNYILDVKDRTARKIELSTFNYVPKKIEGVKPKDGSGTSAVEHHEKAETVVKIERARGGAVMVAPGPGGMAFEHSFTTKIDPKNSRKDSLGKQTVEGVEAEGTRFTTTIPAGEIGNEAPINIVSERWYSEELQTVIMSKHSDPRFGENTYRLTNINRSEPARSLFEVPSDYTIKETVSPNMRYKIEREVRRPGSDN